jgi:hypothetical protein
LPERYRRFVRREKKVKSTIILNRMDLCNAHWRESKAFLFEETKAPPGADNPALGLACDMDRKTGRGGKRR